MVFDFMLCDVCSSLFCIKNLHIQCIYEQFQYIYWSLATCCCFYVVKVCLVIYFHFMCLKFISYNLDISSFISLTFLTRRFPSWSAHCGLRLTIFHLEKTFVIQFRGMTTVKVLKTKYVNCIRKAYTFKVSIVSMWPTACRPTVKV